VIQPPVLGQRQFASPPHQVLCSTIRGERCISEPMRFLFKVDLLEDGGLVVKLTNPPSAQGSHTFQLQQFYIMSLLDEHFT